MLKKFVETLERFFSKIFMPRGNPLYFLGALAVFFMWLLLATGIYLFVFYKIETPYLSVRYLTEQWYLGGIIRSVHRYAADGLIFCTVLHLTYVLIKGRHFKHGWLPWVSGVVLFLPILITGVIGYWLVWDKRGEMIGELTAKLFNLLPFSGESPSFFFILLFIHIAIPVLLFILTWIHVMKLQRPVINPTKRVSVAVIVILILMSVLKPATILNPANIAENISILKLDWFYLFPYPLLNIAPASHVWMFCFIMISIITTLPWLINVKKSNNLKSNVAYLYKKGPILKRYFFGTVSLLIPVFIVLLLSDKEYVFSDTAASSLKISIKYLGKRVVDCDEAFIINKEGERYREVLAQTGKANMKLKKIGDCSRERHPVVLEVYIDDKMFMGKSCKPAGWKKDGASFIYENLQLSPGRHLITVKIRDSIDSEPYILREMLDFKEGEAKIISFDKKLKLPYVR